jgi:hypothetical protein
MTNLARRHIPLIALAALLAACSPPGPTPTDEVEIPPIEPTVEQPTFTPLPPTADPSAGGLSEFEIAAAERGEAPYTGNNCSWLADQCTCNEPLVLSATFTFTEDEHLIYAFDGGTYSSQWQMDHVGPNQWGYSIPSYDGGGNIVGAYFYVITFSEDGFVMSQRQELGGGADPLTCPDVPFRTIAAGGTP